MLSTDAINAHLQRLSYKPGWELHAYDDPFEGQKLRIVVHGMEDSYNPGATIDLGVDSFMPPMRDTRQLEDFVFWRLSRVETHETMEWFKLDGSVIWDPHVLEPELATGPLE